MSTLTNDNSVAYGKGFIEPTSTCCDFESITNKISDFAGAVAFGIAAIIFGVAHPIIGPLGALGCLIKAAYDGILLNYHWRHSREKDVNGELIEGTEFNMSRTNFRDRNSVFKESDLERLQHEVDRLYYLNAVTDDLRWARGLAKCTIPILGLLWVFTTEASSTGSLASVGCQCCPGGGHITDEEWLEFQIAKLEGKNPSVPVAERDYY
jgi:hypothetical protein